MIASPSVMVSDNIQLAWAQAYSQTLRKREVVPLVTTFSVQDSGMGEESNGIREQLDEELAARGLFSSATVANTIFPISLWRPGETQEHLYSTYLQILPVLWKYPQNRRGLYFERLIDYGNNKKPGTGVNQLAHIIESWHRGNHRRSGLQAAIFDPHKDHINSPYLGFPCLHQVAFVPTRSADLGIVGYYGRQYIFEKAYGNYLGLVRLGHFMAHEMGLRLKWITVVAGVATFSAGVRKSSLQELTALINTALGQN